MGHYLGPFYLCSPLAPPPTRSGDRLNFKPCGLGGGRGRPRVQASPGREPWGELPLLAPPGTARSRGATTAHHREPGSGSRRKVPLPAGVTASSPRGLWPPLRPSRPASSGSSHLPKPHSADSRPRPCLLCGKVTSGQCVCVVCVHARSYTARGRPLLTPALPSRPGLSRNLWG